MNVKELRELITSKPSGTVLEITTSQYADNTWVGDPPDGHSSAAACRAVINEGIVTGSCKWRYYELTVV